MAKLFTPFQLRETTFKNRIFVSPMCQYSATDGLANQWHLVHYGSRAVGGAGLVMVEATGVCPEGRITPHCLGIWSDAHTEALRPIVDFIKQQGAVLGIQIGHAGRKASCAAPWNGSGFLSADAGGWQTMAPSALALSPDHATPKALSGAEIDDIAALFVAAAKRALAAGFEVLELHSAHGYLLHEFLSPLTNQRSDEYGGSLANRCRLPLKIAKLLRELWPQDKPVFVRISVTDWVDNGWDLAQSIQLAKWLKQLGIDLLDCSSGGLLLDAKMRVGVGFQTGFSAAIRAESHIATSAVGLITSAAQAEHILITEQADAVFLARELLRDPNWPLHAAHELGADVTWPAQYVRAKI
ncbi:MAG: NADH:flavin oxidoreductase/NADH oxidase [Methylophilaceae bacterium]|nr:NADH:flavin oxidoreductase/NADH oxidase [Methylophilaceae bacterium]